MSGFSHESKSSLGSSSSIWSKYSIGSSKQVRRMTGARSSGKIALAKEEPTLLPNLRKSSKTLLAKTESKELTRGSSHKIIQKKRAAFKIEDKKVDSGLKTDTTESKKSARAKITAPPTIDLNELINQKVKKFKDNSFVYLTYTCSPISQFFTPYSLIEVPYQKVDPKQFYTISKHGVTYFSTEENHFTKLSVWQTEYEQYSNLVKIKSFKLYRIWKGFKVWQKTLQWRKYYDAQKYLENNLITATPALGAAILRIRRSYCHFIDTSPIENQHLFYFIEAQMLTYEVARDALISYRRKMAPLLHDACYEAIIRKGFHPEDEALIYTTQKRLREMMSFTERTKKRKYCIFLSNFLNLCDFMTISFVHIMLKQSYYHLAQILRAQDVLGPTEEQLKIQALDVQIEAPRPSSGPKVPLFIGELVLKPDKVEIDPSKDKMLYIFNQLIGLIEESVYGMKRFQSDPMYYQFTKPSIAGRQEEFLAGRAPDIGQVINCDKELLENREFIFAAIHRAYYKAEIYTERFELIRINYEIDFNTDPQTIINEQNVDNLREYCVRYNEEMTALEGIIPIINLGLLQLKQDTFKEEVIPVCRNLLTVLDNHIPKITNAAVNNLTVRADGVLTKLTTMPEMTNEFVTFLRYLNECGKVIDEYAKEMDSIFRYYILMSDYHIQLSEEEKEYFMDCEDLIIHLREVLEETTENRQQYIDRLAERLQKDIKKIFEEVEEVNKEIVKEWLILDTSDPAEVKETISNLMERLVQCQQLSGEYRKYQREFRIDVTRFDLLDTVMQEVRLRQILWESLEEWSTSISEWNNQPFSTLVVDDLINVNGKILKNCTLLEKNLPKNKIVPQIRKEAEEFKLKLPTIGYLRNVALKPRHWIKIETVVDRKVYQDDTVTIQTYEESGAFTDKKAEEIMEVSGQASAELGLEVLLKKVEMCWKEMELSVVSHRESKDVFILAGLDELQSVLDESNININTIAASRNVGPIKPKVDEWRRLLDMFSDTLEEWSNCQTNWIYLEAIFSAPDIQRQLPQEAKMFATVDKNWKDLMRKSYKMPLALPAMTDPQTLKTMRLNNQLLDHILRCLEAYLETKRVSFPRFYFLSNDELLEILAQTRNPHAVQPHLRKCFDAIAKLEFGSKENTDGGLVLTNDILAMISPEGEKVLLGIGLKARGPVEDWLSKVEEAMFLSLKRCTRFAYKCYPTKDRTEWFQEHPNQVVLTISQQQWASEVHAILDNVKEEQTLKNMKDFEQKCLKDLQNLAVIARSDISKLLRSILCALITIDVHARDTISNLVASKVVKSNDFNWLKMLRYYWVVSSETIDAKMSSATLPYFYEYLGAGGVLVITPLTDRCYLCLMGALQMDLGGAPAGPAGTGKTETTKDLAKALAKQCVVFNCSEGLDYKMMGRFFSGLAQSGAWCCFDEFNRIDIEVLSVIAQQLITIRNAKAARMKRFMFEGREIKLNMSCAAFITMNPGYAGRTELPDNLKALFRPIAMMVPDYALIAEVILYSEGFEDSKTLARKMVQMYKLCSEQLSQQDHYDFGMRAVKSVLVMAGALKRAAPDRSENITLIMALRDSNLPKFLADDAILFKGILSDLFPGLELPIIDYGHLERAIIGCMREKKLQPIPELVLKTIQLYETMCVRWGVMLVGPTGGGKTSVLHTLACALTKLWVDEIKHPQYRNVRIQTLNPKAITLDELYGAVDSMTMEWKDGLLGLAVRTAVTIVEEEHQWVVCDGPVDAVWIENLNTVLDDNKMLCLANSERIKLTAWVHMVFEVQDLAQASPATVSRCGMVYVDPGELGWRPLVRSWSESIPVYQISEELMNYLWTLFDAYIDKCLEFVRRKGLFAINQVDVSKITMICQLLDSLTKDAKDLIEISKDDAKTFLFKSFIWCTLWSIGCNLMDSSKQLFEKYIRELLGSEEDSRLPELDLWEYRINPKEKNWENWLKIIDSFKFNPDVRFFDILVPTADTTKFGHLAYLLLKKRRPVMFTGDTGVGKSVLAQTLLIKLSKEDVIPVFINFSAQTNSNRTQELIEGRLDKRKKTLLGAPIGKSMIFFVDDVNMPKLDTYGSQPPIELLRQFLDFGGFFDREKLFWKDVVDVIVGCACAPPGGGRNPLTPRFVRHFSLFLLPPPNTKALTSIFSAIINGFLGDFAKVIQPLGQPIVDAAVSVYTRISQELLPTPTKSHYVFNLRDLSKCVQGILQADSSNYQTKPQILRLFYHESLRVFHDRLVDTIDKGYFKQLLKQTCLEYFKDPVVKEDETLMFGDFMVIGQAREERIYEEIKDVDKLKSVLFDYLEDYNALTCQDVKLILFHDAVEHILRLARLLRAERANGLLVGLSGMGKQSLSRLGAHINDYRCIQIELSRGYGTAAFHDDLRKLYWVAGIKNNPTVFLFTDTQIVKEEFLEDINNILNSGEVPNLFEADEFEKVVLAGRDDCMKDKNRDCSRDGIYSFFISRVRANLHIVICMSPVGDAFRRRCRMFPSLVNCCTIDWFVKWPPEALYSVSLESLSDVAENAQQNEDLAQICVNMHQTVEEASERLYKEYRRHYYTTPSSYLELLKLYHSLLSQRAEIINAKRARIKNGLTKILETNDIVAVMQEELKVMAPMLEKQSAEMQILLKTLKEETATADAFKTRVLADEAEAKIKETAARGVADEARKDLEIASPALKAAEDALNAITKGDINELRSFASPPAMVQFVMEAVCILMNVKTTWESAKKLMADVNFLKKLIEYDKEHIKESTLKKLKAYIEHKDFDPVKIEKVSKVAKSVALWVLAMDQFAKIFKIVEPKIIKAREAEAELKQIMAILKQKRKELAAIEGQIQALKDNLDERNREFQVIQGNVDLTMGRLNRAGRLTSALSDEEIRWTETVKNLTEELWAIPGDVLVASACVAYLGAFPSILRKEMTNLWVEDCQKYKIPSNKTFSLIAVLGDSYEIRTWNMHHLPRDEISTENGIVVTKALRFPLMIDPQEQANRWIRSMENENGLRVNKINDPLLLKSLEICIRQGLPLLIEELGEAIDPALGPVLGRQIISQAGRLILKLGDTEIDYDTRFRLYMTTKLSNPHYLPEVCVTVTLVNFLVTEEGLEDQLLAEVVAIELPELEKQRTNLVVRINEDKQLLIQLEDKVLKLLYSSQGNILDDEELVETLNEAKETSAVIAARLIDTEETEAVITVQREKYRVLAARGSVLFFVIVSLAEIDPMYQFSLKYFTAIFCSIIEVEHEKVSLEERLRQLMADEIYGLYLNISRALFEKHKLVFSFLLSIAVEKQEGRLPQSELDFVLRGPIGTSLGELPKPKNVQLSEYQWKCLEYLQIEYKHFKGICNDIGTKTVAITIGDFKEEFCFVEGEKKAPVIKTWNRLLVFQKIMVVNAIAPDKFVIAIGAFIRETLGKRFTEVADNSSLPALYADTSNNIPLIFILSTGSDPMASFLRFTHEMNFIEKFFSISLGQGQGPAAENLIENGRLFGNWIFLQNCHLATSWMASLEEIVRNLALGNVKAHENFRLFLSSMPSNTFPVSVLQNSVKVTNEPPKGIKANLIRSLGDLTKDFFENHALGSKWKAMVFGLCMFHGVVLERRKFGPLGWNIKYEFNESDRECGLKTLDMYCQRDRVDKIPWDALEYINGEVTWGGRVTDYWDQRCLKTILKTFSSERILNSAYTYSESGVYRCPNEEELEAYREYCQNLPYVDDPEIFGMNENANLAFQTNETTFFISTLLEGQPRRSGGGSTGASDELISGIISNIRSGIAKKILTDNILQSLMERDKKGRVSPLTTVVLQEMERFNKLLTIVHNTLNDLEKAIKGLIVMSEALEAVFNSFLNNQVPALWNAKGFLSTKSLAYWIVDLQYRVDFIQSWINVGLPQSSWISGMYFPQSFITGVLQAHSRKYNLPIDSLKVDYEVLKPTISQAQIFAKHQQKEKNETRLYMGLTHPDNGIYVHGMFIEAGRWDDSKGGLCDANPREMISPLPAVWLKPAVRVLVGNRYEAPLYKTQVRAGVLSTTGHSTNFVLTLLLKSKNNPDFWVLRGTALITAVTE